MGLFFDNINNCTTQCNNIRNTTPKLLTTKEKIETKPTNIKIHRKKSITLENKEFLESLGLILKK